MRSESRIWLELSVFMTLLVIDLLLLTVSYDASIIAMAIFTFSLGFFFRPERLLGWIPALLISGLWILASGDMYEGYNTFKLKAFGITLFPVIAWPAFLALAYTYALPFVRIDPWPLRWFVLSLLWVVGLIVAEWMGYHLLGVHLSQGQAWPGWPILDIFHSPPWMQAAYFANGIVFMGLASWMDRGLKGRGYPVRAR